MCGCPAVEMATALHKSHEPINSLKTGGFYDEGSSGSFFAFCQSTTGGALGLSRGRSPGQDSHLARGNSSMQRKQTVAIQQPEQPTSS